MEKFRTVQDLILKHHSVLGYSLVTLVTAGGERIFSTVVFECPCSATWNLSYGLVFLLVPMLVLFLLGYVIRARTWRLLTGCCTQGTCTCRVTAQVCAQLSGTAALAPLTWLAVALLGGSFYECAASGSPLIAGRLCAGRDLSCRDELPLVPCKQATKPDVQSLLKDLKAQSQVLGWILIAVVIIFLLILLSVERCRSPVSYMQLKFWEVYVEQERKIFRSQATELANKVANKNVECFFQPSQRKENDIPSMKDWQQISSVYTFNPKSPYYSLLHKYAHTREKSDSKRSSKGEAVVPILNFVDELGINTTPGL